MTVVVTAIIALSLTACGGRGSGDGGTTASTAISTGQPSAQTASPTETTSEASESGLPIEAALAALQTVDRAVPGGSLFSLDSGEDDGKPVFNAFVPIRGGNIRLVIDASGEQLITRDPDIDTNPEDAPYHRPDVSAADAVRKASEGVSGARFWEVREGNRSSDVGGDVIGPSVWRVVLVTPNGTMRYEIDQSAG
jgi:hypothetical protein